MSERDDGPTPDGATDEDTDATPDRDRGPEAGAGSAPAGNYGSRSRSVARLLVLAGVTLVAVVAGWFLFVEYPIDLTDLLGVLLALSVAAAGLRAGARIAGSAFPSYNVAEVAVEGPITRDGGGSSLRAPVGATADDVVESIERADADDAVDGLIVKLNTPGGEIVPSADIRLAAERFDGPTVARAVDTCASGGYDIASGCDELWAREGSIVGSVGVIGSRVTAGELRDRLGLSYEGLTAGEYKDAGTPLRDLDEDERAYLQGIVDDYYDSFVETVAAGRGMDPETVRETEARIYLGREAEELGLVDAIGTRRDVEDRLAELLDEPVSVREFEPQRGLAGRLRGGAARVAHVFGAGLAGRVDGEGERVRFRE